MKQVRKVLFVGVILLSMICISGCAYELGLATGTVVKDSKYAIEKV